MNATPDNMLVDPKDRLIADLQRQLAEVRRLLDRRAAERDEALAQRTATAEVLQVINSSSGDLAPVFDAMLEKAVRLCEATFGAFLTYDGERFATAALHNLPLAYLEFMTRDPPQPGPQSAMGRTLQGERVVVIEDVTRDHAYYAGDPRRRAIVELGEARSYIAVGLFKDDKLIGALATYRQEIRPFTDKQIVLLQNFAAQAVIAMENARLMTETREALEQQTATAEVLGVINASPGDLKPVFDAMLEKAMRLCDARFGQLVTSADGEIFTVAAAQGPPAIVEFLRNRPPTRPGSGTSMERLVRGERCVHIHDAIAEEAYRRGDPIRRALVDLGGCRTLVSVGLRKDDALLGAITVYRSEVKPFSTNEIALIENFAAQAVIAIENARLITETREALDQQTATAEVLQVINSSPGDLAPVFDAVLQKAHQLCEASFGALMTFDGEKFYPVATQGVPARFRQFIREGGIRPSPGNPFARMVEGESFSHIHDLRKH